MSSQLFVSSTAFGLATLVAALDAGLFGPAERRVLVLSTNAEVPEISPGPTATAGVHRLLERFDAVYDYNDVVAPQHPTVWRPRGDDLPLWQRQLSRAWGLRGAALELVVESIQTPPALVLAQLFAEARITVYGDGLMSYGPTRTGLPSTVAARIERLLHLDLVPGVRPVLLTEFEVPAVSIPTPAFRAVVAQLGPAVLPAPPAGSDPAAVLLGQYLAAAGLITDAEERQLHREMVRGAVAAGFRHLVFKPHPGAAAADTAGLVAEAERCGARLQVAAAPELVETWYAAGGVGLVVGCFSTGLLTATALYGVPAARVGTELVLRRLRPYANSNRVPAVIADAALPPVSACARHADSSLAPVRGAELQALVDAVAYCMQPARYPGLRDAAERVLAVGWRAHRGYWSRRVLTELDLPGRTPAPRHPAVRALRRIVGPRRYRRLTRAWSVVRAR